MQRKVDWGVSDRVLSKPVRNCISGFSALFGDGCRKYYGEKTAFRAAEKGRGNSAAKGRYAGTDKRFANKMDTLVGREFAPDGAVFSGGETQKLAIARAIAKDAPVLILDEPSSALDPIAENKMFEAIFDSFRDKTVIYILHRLSSATFADRIYLLENGQIAEQGTHAELIALNGKYADMFHKQAEKYIS